MSGRYAAAAVGLAGGILGLGLMLGGAVVGIPALVWVFERAPWPLLVGGWLGVALVLKRWEERSR